MIKLEKKILLVCNAGMSTSMLVKKMQASAENKDLNIHIQALSDPEARKNIPTYNPNIIMLGPQIRYLKDDYISKYPNIPIEVINMQDYGTMNGEKVLNLALEIIGGEN